MALQRSLGFNVFMLFLVLLSVLIPCLLLAAESGTTEAVPGADAIALLLAYIPESWGQWVTFVVTLCAALAVLLPAPKEGANILWRWLYWLVQALALNKGHAANAQDIKAPQQSGKPDHVA